MSQFEPTEFVEWLRQKHGEQTEFLQAAEEVALNLKSMINDSPTFKNNKILQRLAEPDRIISFRITWVDDNDEIQINKGWRVQQSNALGPYKGGLRFHPTVNESVLKFLAFEQCFKNALTDLPIGGGKGGADFDPKGRSDNEIMRFCQAFMMELHRHIGPKTDVPAGDINVGAKEIGYLYGQYKRIKNEFGGYLTGKDIEFGGSHVRTEATGFGVIYFLENVLKHHNVNLKSKRITLSGAGNVATYAAQKAIEEGAVIVSMSNSKGTLSVEKGLSSDELYWLKAHSDKDNVLKSFAEEHDSANWLADQKPWQLECDIAAPCATQNELDEHDAKCLANNGCKFTIEGANMPCTAKAVNVFKKHGVVHIPGKASNAGGVAVSGLEMSQNAGFERRGFAELDSQLQSIMQTIHDKCVEFGRRQDGTIDYALGANRAAFNRLASALVAQGV
ncbi:NADP-specific glutamate dehydrogenase [Aliiglaciecola litoralis]|uniref:Glutamate dehydrogenase n=1 Tax=Aliiglaciecola litoralis TaxID=582857 RepID=A0ABN1LEB7_9ALTE